MTSTPAEDRRPRDRNAGGAHIDTSVLAAVGTGEPVVGVATFCRWFRCFATAGKEE